MATRASSERHNGHDRRKGYSGWNGYPRLLDEQHRTTTGDAGKLDPLPGFSAKAYRPAGKLTGKVAIITGADRGIGRVVAIAYAREGADVAILHDGDDRDAAETRRAVEDAGRRVLTIRGDTSDDSFCRRAARQVVDELGHIDILVSNAAVQVSTDDVLALRREQLERTFQVNVFGYFFMVQACLPFMAVGSAIIATGSETGIFGSDRLPDYSATQGAIHALTRSLAQQLLPRGVRVNAVAPGPEVSSPVPATPGSPPDAVAAMGKGTDRGEPVRPEDLAPAYVFFASNADSSFITGQVLAELGGVMR